MKQKIKSTLIVLLTLISCTTSTNAEDKKPLPSSIQGNKVNWKDGKNDKSAVLMSDFVLEIVGSSGESKMKSVDKGSSTILEGRRIKVHKISDSSLKFNLGKGNVPDSLKKSGTFIPVFSENGADTHLLAPIGNIIVELDPSYSEKKAKEWADEYNLKILNKLSFGNYYVIESPAGMISIDKANFLLGKPGVVSATPELWSNYGVR